MQYRAFLSYSRQDDKVAGWLHRQLDAYRTPKTLVGSQGASGPVPPKLHPIYRDRTDTAGGGHLADKIEAALRDSKTLIVLCSPAAVASPWVDREVATFLNHRSDEHIFPVIAAGLPNADDVERDFFPPALRGRGLLAADLREIRLPNGKLVGDGREGAKLKLIAGLLEVGLDQLVQRERAAERRRRTVAYAIAAVLGALAIATAAAGLFALDQRNVAIREQERAERGEASARAAQSLAERNAQEREEQRVLATYNADQANIQRGVAEANALEAGEQRDRAFNALALTFAERSWQAIDRGDLSLSVRYALAGWRIAPDNSEAYRAALGAALQVGHDTILPTPLGLLMGFDDLEISTDGRRLAASYWSPGFARSGKVVVWKLASDGRWSEEQRFDGQKAAFSPDGTRLAVGGDQNGLVKVYDVATGNELASIKAAPEHESVDSVAFSPDGLSIITAWRDVVVWDSGDGHERLHIAPEKNVKRALFTPDGRFIIVQDVDDAYVYEASAGVQLRKLPELRNFGPHPFSPDGSTMVGTANPRIFIVDIQKAEVVQTFTNARGYVGDAPSFSPDGSMVIAPSENNTAVVWDALFGREQTVLRGHADMVWSAIYGPKDGSILTATNDGIRIWKTGPERRVWRIEKPMVFDAAIGSAGPHIGVRGEGGVRVVHPATDKTDLYPDIRNRITIGPEGDGILVWRDYAAVDIINADGARAGLPVFSTGEGRYLLANVEVNKDFSRIATSSSLERSNYPRTTMLWDGDGRIVATLADKQATTMAFSPSGDRLFVTLDESGMLYDGMTGRELVKIKSTGRVDRPLFSPDGERIATVRDSDGMLWDARSGAALHFFERSGAPLAFSASGRLLATSSGAVWDTRSGALLASISSNSSEAMAFSPDATRLVSVGSTGVQVWDSSSGEKLATLARYDHATAEGPNLSWVSKDGQRAFGHYGDGVTAMWDISRLTLPLPMLARMACERFLPPDARVFSDVEVRADPLLREMWQPARSASREIVLPPQPPAGGGTWLALTHDGFQIHGDETRSVCAQ